LADKLFEREFGLKAGAGVGSSGGDAARENIGDRLQVDVKMIGHKVNYLMWKMRIVNLRISVRTSFCNRRRRARGDEGIWGSGDR